MNIVCECGNKQTYNIGHKKAESDALLKSKKRYARNVKKKAHPEACKLVHKN